MTFDEYLKTIVLKLKSDKFYGELIPVPLFDGAMDEFVVDAKMIDIIKKALFYGKTDPILGVMIESLELPDEAPYCDDTPLTPEQKDMTHAALGLITETAEIAELVFNQDGTTSRLKMLDEMGDLLWYLALMCSHLDTSFEEIMEINSIKLKTRFGDKFSTEKASGKDVQNEYSAIRAM